MKILYLNPSGQIGGAEASLLTLLKSLRRLHPTWQLHLISAAPGPLVSRAVELGLRVDVLPFSPLLASIGDSAHRNTLKHLLHLCRAGVSTYRYGRSLSATISRIQPDILHTNGFKMHLLAGRQTPSQIPIVYHLHDYISQRPLVSRVFKRCLGKNAMVVTNSKSVAEDAAQICGSRLTIRSIYNAVDTERFTSEGSLVDLDARANLPRCPDDFVKVGLIATFAHWKGHFTFLRAISLLPNEIRMRGYLIGGPIYQTESSQVNLTELQQEARRLGIEDKIGFTGFIENPAEAMRALDIVVHASSSPEPFGMVIIEAMACGKAVIASNAGGASEIIQDEVTALAHPMGDAQALSHQISRLVQNPALRARLGANGSQMAIEQFHPANMAKQFAHVYEQLARRRSIHCRYPVSQEPQTLAQ